jgi:hypothetical protein
VRPSVVVPSGHTDTSRPLASAATIRSLVARACRRLPRSMKSVPIRVTSRPTIGQPRMSDLATKSDGATA